MKLFAFTSICRETRGVLVHASGFLARRRGTMSFASSEP